MIFFSRWKRFAALLPGAPSLRRTCSCRKGGKQTSSPAPQSVINATDCSELISKALRQRTLVQASFSSRLTM